jgi:hypothetical protein
MTIPALLVATWDNGLVSFQGDALRREMAGRPVRGLSADGRGGALAIVDGHRLCRRSPDGDWTELARSEDELSCCVPLGDSIFLGTDDARILRVGPDGRADPLPGFEAVAGRETWYAGAALVDGRLMGPPLGIRSIDATCDGGALLANVHVGGIPRSTDFGGSWQPTIEVDADVHQVCAHPEDPRLAIAAAAAGLCISRDGGASWTIDGDGLHADYCSAVAFGKAHLFVAASTDHFAREGALYRGRIDGSGPLERLGSGLPEWLDGIVDTGCLAARGAVVAAIDRAGHIHVSRDDGDSWTAAASGPAGASAMLIC